MVICLHGQQSPWQGSAYPRSDELSQPLLPSRWASNGSKGSRRRKVDTDAGYLYARALEYTLGTIPVSKGTTRNGCWLAALIRLESINCGGWLDHIYARWSNPRKDSDPKEQLQLSIQISDLCKTLQSDISQVVALQRTPRVHLQCSDYEEELLMLERLLGEAKVIAADARESLDMQHRVKNTQVAELAINESRSAIAGKFVLKALQQESHVLTTVSNCPCICLYSHQPSFLRVRNECAGDQ